MPLMGRALHNPREIQEQIWGTHVRIKDIEIKKKKKVGLCIQSAKRKQKTANKEYFILEHVPAEMKAKYIFFFDKI